jgi:CBS domain-containing protein
LIAKKERVVAPVPGREWKGFAMRVEDVIETKGRDVVTVTETSRVKDAVRLMETRGIGAVVVVATTGMLKGVVSEREVIVALALRGAAALDQPVRDLMAPAGPVVAPTDTILCAMKIMTEHRARHLPVIAGRSVVGLLSIGDTVKARLSEKTAENLILQDIARWPPAAVA